MNPLMKQFPSFVRRGRRGGRTCSALRVFYKFCIQKKSLRFGWVYHVLCQKFTGPVPESTLYRLCKPVRALDCCRRAGRPSTRLPRVSSTVSVSFAFFFGDHKTNETVRCMAKKSFGLTLGDSRLLLRQCAPVKQSHARPGLQD